MMRQQSNPAPRIRTKLNRQIGVTIDALGEMLVSEVTAQDLLAVLNPVAASDRGETAHEVRTRISQIFRYAVARGLVTHDPAAFTIDAMVQHRRGEFSGITDPKELGELREHFDLNLDHRSLPLAVGSNAIGDA